jgi:signal transduction histidine kinase
MRLRTKYALVLLGILLVLGTVVVGSAELFKQQTIEQEQTELDDTTELAAGQVNQAISDQVDVIRQTALTIDEDSQGSRSERLTQLRNNHDFNVALIADSEGNITTIQGLQTDQQQEMIGTSLTEAGFLSEATLSSVFDGNTRIERVQAFDQIDDFAVNVAAPILSQDATEVEGVLLGSFYIESTRLFSPLTPLETTQQTVRVTGTTFDGEQATILQPEDSFEQSLVSQAEVSDTGWTITVMRDESALTSRLQFLQLIQFGSLLVVLLTVFILGFYQYRTTLQQTNKLLDGFDALAEGDYWHTLDLGSAEEWSQIGEGFNTMASGLKTRERQIRERERRLSVLNRVLRHNLQNDMTVIQGYAEVLPPMGDRDQREDASEKILEKSQGLVEHGKKARRLETVMENAEEGKSELDIGGNISDYLDTYEEEYPDVTVEYDALDDAWVEAVSGIEFGIQQLIENAFVHNTSEDPRVEVMLDQDGDDLLITVQDNGPGIPEHERDVLIQDEETSLEHGSGIGLWLAYWAVVKSDGEIEFGDQDDGGHVVVRLDSCEPPEDAGDDDELFDF